ncbi:hypothetical protein SCG7086_AS_00060 [Chlamydiales bacterium SCGC AG-110-P3]|nr:hypothetical protein SCG7086_AS_00060 [Chlamydiales bacterium SCGC AG-110-P3]
MLRFTHTLLHLAIWCSSLLFADNDVEARIMALSQRATATPLAPERSTFFPKSGVSDLLLPNGMRVVLKPMPDTEETLLHLFATGGSTSFPPEQVAEAKYCGTFALASDLTDISQEELWEFNFKYMIEVSARTRPFQRRLECSVPTDYLEQALAVIHHFLTDTQVTQKGMNRVLESAVDAIRYRSAACDVRYEDLYLSVNSGGHPLLKPATVDQLNSIDFKDAQSALRASFRNAAQFTAVIVGEFDIETALPLILRYLGTIPGQTEHALWPNPALRITFPKGKLSETLTCGHQGEILTRITSPIKLPLTHDNINAFEVATQVLELRLRSRLFEKLDSSYAVNVQYHLPLFPWISSLWLTVQYRCPSEKIPIIERICIEEMHMLQETPPSAKEMQTARTLLHRVNFYWLQQTSFWTEMLSNYLEWGWSPACIAETCESLDSVTSEMVHSILQQSYDIHNYTLLSLDSQE